MTSSSSCHSLSFHGDYWGNHHWRGGYDDDWKAREAYEALIRFSLILPDGPSLPAFTVEAKMRSQRDYNYTYREDEDVRHCYMESDIHY